MAFQSIFVRKSTVGGSTKKLVAIVLVVNFIIWSALTIILHYPSFEVNMISFISFLSSGFFGFFLGYRLLFLSIQRIGASRTMPLIKTQVITALALSILFLGESLSSFHLIGVVLIVVGAALVSREISNDKEHITSEKRWFDLSLPLLAGFFWGLNWFFTRFGLMHGTSVIMGLMISSFGGILGFLVIEGFKQKRISLKSMMSPNLYWYVVIALFCASAFYLNFLALSISRIVVVNPIWQVAPLFVLILSYILLPKLEKITLTLLVGSVIIVVGTIVVLLFM